MTQGPTRGATQHRSWSASPATAFAVRALVMLIPIVASFLVTRVVAPVLWRPAGWPGLAAFVAQAGVVGGTAALLAGRAARRLLPLAAVLNMTLVFPDRAPPRFSTALRTGTVRQLKRDLAAGSIDWPDDHQEAAEQLIAMVNELGRHERLTRGHTERVRAYADLIGEELGLSADDRDLLHWAAMVHDIGKLTVPPDILNKEGRPTEAEWAILQQHPAEGGKMLEPLAGWLGEWRFAASQHHERWDGTGYPEGLAGTDISLAGRIVAVADAYDVINSKRSYKQPMSADAARQEMVRCSGTQFDPEVVRALLTASLGRDRTSLGLFGWIAELAAIPRMVVQAAAPAATATAVVASAVSAPFPFDPAEPVEAAQPPITAADDRQPDELALVDLSTTVAPRRPTSPPTPRPTTSEVESTVTTGSGPIPDPPVTTATTAPTPTPEPTEAETTSTSSTTTTDPPTTASSSTTTTDPPTTTTTSASTTTVPTTTTTAPTTTAPTAFTWNLGGAGSTTAQAILPLDGPLQAGSLPNYDTDRDADPGLYVQKGDGLSETDPDKFQRWAGDGSDIRLQGTPVLTLWVATKDFDTDKQGRLAIGLYDCNSGHGGCTLLTSTSATFDQGSYGNGFGQLTITMPAIDHIVASNRTLVLKLATRNGSDDDLWFAYATTAYPTNLTIS